MGLLRSFAKRVVARVAGADASAPPPPPSAPPPAAPAVSGGRGSVAVLAGEEGPVAEAEALANLEAGAQEVYERVEAGEPVVLLDVREPEETRLGVIPGARCIPLRELEARWRELEKCNEIVCYCAHGQRSVAAARLLRAKGLFNATSLEGGVAAWQACGGRLG